MNILMKLTLFTVFQFSAFASDEDFTRKSEYEGVYWDDWAKTPNKWSAGLDHNNLEYYIGDFKNEKDAAKAVNSKCRELKIPIQNPQVEVLEDVLKCEAFEQLKQEVENWFHSPDNSDTDNYIDLFNENLGSLEKKGVLSEKESVDDLWFRSPDKLGINNNIIEHLSFSIQKYGELKEDVLKDTEQKFSTISLNAQTKKIYQFLNSEKEKKKIAEERRKAQTSEYEGVYWHKALGKWIIYIKLYSEDGQKWEIKYGGIFDDELEAAMSVNQMCVKERIPLKNPEIIVSPNKLRHQNIKLPADISGLLKQNIELPNNFAIKFTPPHFTMKDHHIRTPPPLKEKNYEEEDRNMNVNRLFGEFNRNPWVPIYENNYERTPPPLKEKKNVEENGIFGKFSRNPWEFESAPTKNLEKKRKKTPVPKSDHDEMNIKRKTKVSESREEMDSPEFASPVKTKKKK